MSFWAELRRRNVFRVGAVYLAGAWVLSQVGSLVAQSFAAPTWPMRMLLVLLAIGFPVALVVAWLFELTPQGLKLTAQVAPEASIMHHTGRRLDRVLIGMIGLLIVVLLVDRWVLPAREAETTTSSVAAGAAAAAPNGAAAASPLARLEHSVAVLPLANMSPNPSDAYFAAGIHEEILNYLAKLKSVNVIARTSVARYANTDKSIQDIGAELNVETVMEGSVRYADNRVRVTTQLIDARSGAHLWSEAYERDFKDIFAIQADIAMSVANALNATFSPEEQRQVERVPTTSPEAYALALQAWDLGGRGNQSPQILALLDQAIARDPNFAAPYGFKADTYASLLINTTYGSASDRAQTEALARNNAKQALALNPTDAQANGALANIDLFNWRWADARQTYERAYAATGFPVGYFRWFLSWTGQQARAIEVVQHYLALDPNNWGAHWNLGIALLYAGDADKAVAAFHRGIELAPALPLQHSWLAFAEIARNNRDAALRELQLNETLLGSNRAVISLVDTAYGYSRIGRSADAARLFAEIQTLAQKQDIGTGGWASAYLGIGDQQKALEQLRLGAERARTKTLDPGFFTLMNIRMNVTRDPVLEQPEFAAVRAALTGD
jgi:TolB-like protein/Tfp pilus assembly protein PilF